MKKPTMIEFLFWLTFLSMIALALLFVAYVVGGLLQMTVEVAL